MKQFQTEYSESSITYWPSCEAGKFGMIFSAVLGVLFLTTSIWILSDNPSRETRLEIMVALPISVVVLCVNFCFLYRKIHTKVVVSNAGIAYFKNNTSTGKQINWEDVSAVYFSQDLWYGRKACRIFYNSSVSLKSYNKDTCQFTLPVCAVDEQKLLQLIPNYLWKNAPWYN